MTQPWRNDTLQTLADVSAMVFAAKPPEEALQSLADTLGVQAVALGRVTVDAGGLTLLAQNSKSPFEVTDWEGSLSSSSCFAITLHATAEHRDQLILQTRLGEINQDQRSALTQHVPFLSILWASRSDSFDRVLTLGRTPAVQSALHPDNPYGLTRAELRICSLIAAGHRPASMAHSTQTSVTTVRTHLRSIYAKTGLDGMTGVLRNIQIHTEGQKVAS